MMRTIADIEFELKRVRANIDRFSTQMQFAQRRTNDLIARREELWAERETLEEEVQS